MERSKKGPAKGFKAKGGKKPEKKGSTVPPQSPSNASETDHESVMPGAVPDVPHDSPEPQTYSTTLGGGDHETGNPPQPPASSGDEMSMQESMPFPSEVVNLQSDEEKTAEEDPATEGSTDQPTVEPVTEHSPLETEGFTDEDFPTEVVVSQDEVTKSQPSIKPEEEVDYEKRDFDNLDPKDYGIDFEEEDNTYEPPERDNVLPDLHRLMDSLEDGHSDLESQNDPPSLFTRPEHVPKYKKITELKMEIEEDEIGPYVYDFEEGIKDDVLMIGSIALEEVQEEEHRLRDEHIAYQEQEAEAARHRQQEILMREEEAKKRVARNLKEKRRIIKRREDVLQQKERLLMDRLHKAFRRSENQLISVLERRKGEIKTMYGDLTEADGHYGGSKGRRWKVDWDRTPQPIEVKLKCLRGVKDKLPGGRYVLMVSMYNRLGGHVMRWSNLKGQQWGGTTLPITHEGHFYNAEIKMDQNVYTVLPSKPGIRPGMVLVFELFLLRGEVVATDRVVGWGCFPIADDKFDVVEGKYKAPFLRGEMDPRIDKHEKIEELMSSDLDHWLCNLNFEIVKLPRYLAGQKEYEVELQFSSGMLSYPDRVHTGGEEYRDGEYPVHGSLTDIHSTSEGSQQISDEPSITMTQMLNSGAGSTDNDSLDRKPGYKPYNDDIDTKKPRISSAGSEVSQRSLRSAGSLRQRRPMTTLGSRAVYKDKKVTVGDSDSDDYDEEDIYFTKKDGGFYPVKGKPGMYYKKYSSNPVDDYHRKLYTLMPKTPLLTMKKRKKHLTYLEQLEEHTFSVKVPFSDKGHLPSKGMEKINYVRRQMMAELGLSEWRSREFWGMIIMFVLTFFMRMYLHYVGQWLFLQGQVIPITNFDFLPYTVNLLYQPTLLDTVQEAFVVLIGPFINIGFFILLVILSWIMQLVLGLFPDIGSKFVVVYGIEAFLDPFLIGIVDCILLRFYDGGGNEPVADFAKLYWHFDNTQGSGIAGIFITLFLYIFTCFASGAILYMYFLRLHNNGRMLDIYWRLHGEMEMFFVPYDLEISNQELRYIAKKAEQWRGEEGERRKVAVYDYIWEEETVEDRVWDENEGLVDKSADKDYKKEITTHVSIHTLHLDGLRELYRHFLRLPDGAIVEVFGDLSVAGIGKDLKEALNEQTQNLENLMGSQYSLNKVRGRQTAYTNAGFNLEDEEPEKIQPRPTDIDTVSQTSSSAGSLPKKPPIST